jgi:phosphoribosylformylglycinamidine synthase
MAMGERTPLALLNAPASGRMAIGEALTNLFAAPLGKLSDVVLSANWMVAAGQPGEDARLYDTVRAVGMELCPALGICIPVGKDSMSMRTAWTEGGASKQVVSPLSLIVSAFAPVGEVADVATPQLRTDRGPTELLLVDLGRGQNRLGGSVLAAVHGAIGRTPPDLDEAQDLIALHAALSAVRAQVLGYHDRSDGGLFATLCEMAFAGRCGLDIDLGPLGSDPVAALFCEELGAVIQVAASDVNEVQAAFAAQGLGSATHRIGRPTDGPLMRFVTGDVELLQTDRVRAQQAWTSTSHHIASLRDHAACAEQEFDQISADDPGISPHLTFDPNEPLGLDLPGRPRVAILRDQGVNGQLEMAAAFDAAGFESVDVHMTDLAEGRRSLEDFVGLVACGGFSFGDVLGAGGGWAKSVLFDTRLTEQFRRFFHRPNTFTLGVCNGCQMLSQLAPLIPGAEGWPRFVRNESEQFEARVCTVEVLPSPSILLKGMEGSRLPIAVAHGEGLVQHQGESRAPVALRYVDNHGRPTERYPLNPNGSPGGLTGLTSTDGRATILMPHPERVYRTATNSWHPDDWGADGPWMRLFRNARAFVGAGVEAP